MPRNRASGPAQMRRATSRWTITMIVSKQPASMSFVSTGRR
jgi:hypothetical protein